MTKKLTIAVDGFSSCGKSTFAKRIAAVLGYVFIDTGAMYRAVTLYAIEHGISADGLLDAERLVASLDDVDISFRYNKMRGAADIYVNGDMVEGKIRTRSWADQTGAKRYTTEIVADNIRLLDRKGAVTGTPADMPVQAAPVSQPAFTAPVEDASDDLPF